MTDHAVVSSDQWLTARKELLNKGLKTASSMALSLVVVGGVGPPSNADDGRIAVRVVDSAGQITPVRAWVDVGGRRLFEPTSPETATPYAKDSSFSCDGKFTMIVICRYATASQCRGATDHE